MPTKPEEIAIAVLQKQVKLIIDYLEFLDNSAPTLNANTWATEHKAKDNMTKIVKQLREMDSKVTAR